jgi:mannose-6-phosphate isomerase
MHKTIVNKPWGHEEIWAQTNDYVGKVLHINEGQRLSLQYHEKKEETIKVLSGRLEVVYSRQKDGELKSIVLEEGDSFHIFPLMIHRFCATQGTDVDLLEVSTNYLEDVVRLEDDYNR